MVSYVLGGVKNMFSFLNNLRCMNKRIECSISSYNNNNNNNNNNKDFI